MPDKTTENTLVNELADLLIYFSHESEKWKEMLRKPRPNYRTIEQHIQDITGEGIRAGVSEGLAHLVMLRHAESENAELTPEKIAEIVKKPYMWKKEGEEQEAAKKAAKTPPVPKKL